MKRFGLQMSRKIDTSKRVHEAARHIREQLTLLYRWKDVTEYVQIPTTALASDGTGCIYMPSRDVYEHLGCQSSPAGVVFVDGSFLVFKEVFRYDYPKPEAPRPEIVYLEYSYHYQYPARRSFFRFDFHPEVGDPATHPLHHVHAAGWLEGDTQLPAVPRLPTVSLTLERVLDLIQVNFFAD